MVDGFSTLGGGGSVQPSGSTRPPPKGSVDGTPKILPRLTPPAPEVTRTQNFIICHVFGKKN